MTDRLIGVRRGWSVVAILVVSIVAGDACRRSGRAPSGVADRKLSAAQVADRAKPATVLIVVSITGTVTAPEPQIDRREMQSALAPLITDSMSEEDKIRTMFQVLFKTPERFFTRGAETRTAQAGFGASGSGLVISPDGYVVTNAHVVDLDDEETAQGLVFNAIEKFAKADIEGFEQTISRLLNATLRDETKARLFEGLARYYAQFAKISGVSTKMNVVTGSTGTKNEPKLISHEAKLVDGGLGEPGTGNDVAVLKMDGSDFPTLSLARSLDASGIRTGSDLYILGFPGKTTTFAGFSLQSVVEPSETSGRVSALRDMKDKDGRARWHVVETDATINHGNSGGPAFNDRGDVVGLATFGLKDQIGINYLVSIDTVHEILNNAKVTPPMSAYSKKYLQAVDLVEHNQPERALPLFRQLQSERQGVKAVDEFVQRLGAGTKATARSTSPSSGPAERVTYPAATDKPSRSGGSRATLIFGLFAGVAAVILLIVVAANRN